MLVKESEEHADVLEAGVHALAVERYHGVGCIAEDNDCIREVVRATFYGYQWQMGVLREGGDEGGGVDEGGHSREVLIEEGREGVRIRFKSGVMRGWEEKSTRE